MRLTLLLRLAVAAAASPPLNVTLTNNLVGVTTVRVTGAGLRVAATLGADASLLARRRRRRRRLHPPRSGRRHQHAGSRRMPGGSGCRGRWICREDAFLRPPFLLRIKY